MDEIIKIFASVVDYPQKALPPDVWNYNEEKKEYTLKPEVKEEILGRIYEFFHGKNFQHIEDFWLGTVIGSSIGSVFYGTATDVDVKVIIDVAEFIKHNDYDLGDQIWNLVKEVRKSGIMAESNPLKTTDNRPVDIYFINISDFSREGIENISVNHLKRYDSLYYIEKNQWLKEPKNISDIEKYIGERDQLLEQAYKQAEQIAESIDIDAGKVNRISSDILEFEQFANRLEPEQKKRLKTKLDQKINELEKIITEMISTKEKVVEDRQIAFQDLDFNIDYEKFITSINYHPKNLQMKLLQKWSIFSLISKLQDIVQDEETDEVEVKEEDVPEIKKVVSNTDFKIEIESGNHEARISGNTIYVTKKYFDLPPEAQLRTIIHEIAHKYINTLSGVAIDFAQKGYLTHPKHKGQKDKWGHPYTISTPVETLTEIFTDYISGEVEYVKDNFPMVYDLINKYVGNNVNDIKNQAEMIFAKAQELKEEDVPAIKEVVASEKIIAYHGSSKVFDKFEIQSGKAIFFSPDINFAKLHATPVLYTVALALNKIFDYKKLTKDTFNSSATPSEHLTDEGKFVFDSLPKVLDAKGYYADENIFSEIALGHWDIMGNTKLQTWLKENGYDAFYELGEGVENIGVFNEDSIKIIDMYVVKDAVGSALPEFANIKKAQKKINIRRVAERDNQTAAERQAHDAVRSDTPVVNIGYHGGLEGNVIGETKILTYDEILKGDELNEFYKKHTIDKLKPLPFLWYENPEGDRYYLTEDEMKDCYVPKDYPIQVCKYPCVRESYIDVRDNSTIHFENTINCIEPIVRYLIGRGWAMTDAISISSMSCERCLNILVEQSGGEKYPQEQKDSSHTHCELCATIDPEYDLWYKNVWEKELTKLPKAKPKPIKTASDQKSINSTYILFIKTAVEHFQKKLATDNDLYNKLEQLHELEYKYSRLGFNKANLTEDEKAIFSEIEITLIEKQNEIITTIESVLSEWVKRHAVDKHNYGKDEMSEEDYINILFNTHAGYKHDIWRFMKYYDGEKYYKKSTHDADWLLHYKEKLIKEDRIGQLLNNLAQNGILNNIKDDLPKMRKRHETRKRVIDALHRIESASSIPDKNIAISLALNVVHNSGQMFFTLGLSKQQMDHLSNMDHTKWDTELKMIGRVAKKININRYADGTLSDIPTDAMIKHYEKRTNNHIGIVQKYCEKLSDMYSDDIIKHGEYHDKSKFDEPEFIPYVFTTWRYKCKDDGVEFKCSPEMEERMKEATEHHIKNNRHHPEYHTDKLNNLINTKDRDAVPDEMIDATKMSEIDIAEMCADWCAMSEERGNSPKEWADKNVNKRWKFTKEQSDLIYDLINKIWDGKKKINIRRIEASSEQYLTLYHGTSSIVMDQIKEQGIVALPHMGYDSPGWYMFSSTPTSAIFHAVSDPENNRKPYLLTINIPIENPPTPHKWDGYPYVWPPHDGGTYKWYAIRQPIPVNFITDIQELSHEEWVKSKDEKW
jgi:hypothetical protein